MKTLKLSWLLIVAAILFVGCNRQPDDVPKLFPCKITVTKANTPLSGVNIVLGSVNEGVAFVSSGTTNSSGIAEIETKRLDWRGRGVPAGEYAITLSKQPDYTPELSLKEYQKLSPSEQEEYNAKESKRYDSLAREVPPELSEVISSPYQISVTSEQKNELTIDIAEYSGKTKAKKR